jgi:hypothetical protein
MPLISYNSMRVLRIAAVSREELSLTSDDIVKLLPGVESGEWRIEEVESWLRARVPDEAISS